MNNLSSPINPEKPVNNSLSQENRIPNSSAEQTLANQVASFSLSNLGNSGPVASSLDYSVSKKENLSQLDQKITEEEIYGRVNRLISHKEYQQAAEIYAQLLEKDPKKAYVVEPLISQANKQGHIQRMWLKPPSASEYVFNIQNYGKDYDQHQSIYRQWKQVYGMYSSSPPFGFEINKDSYEEIKLLLTSKNCPEDIRINIAESEGIYFKDIEKYATWKKRDQEAQNSSTKCVIVNEFLCDYQGKGLIVGRGAHLNDQDMGEERKEKYDGYYSTDISFDMKPNVCMDMSNAKQLRYYPDNRFEDVYFEHIPCFTINKETLPELYRMLKAGGTLRFATERMNYFHFASNVSFDESQPKEEIEAYLSQMFQDKDDMLQFMKQLGFEEIQITNSKERYGRDSSVPAYGIVEAKKAKGKNDSTFLPSTK
ncbi:MAG: hypothetical protein K0S74_1318 [Chlamydiales bacterium]|jgi:predicted SAM-dependent methyltransferase|nr:hypothetical protein [Chlamydiales bacterium]